MKDDSESFKVLHLFPHGSESFLNFKVSSTRLLINLFLMKNYCNSKKELASSRLKSQRQG